MPIPLARRNINMQAPQAQAGQAFDPSGSIARMGQTAANTLKLAEGAVDNMGKAIVLRQRQDEDFIGKNATLKREEAFTNILTQLEQHQGLDAEKWMKKEGNELIRKAVLESNNALNSIEYSDIKNQYVEDGLESLNALQAKADNYVYKERLNAQNTMSKDIIEYHKRTAKMNAANYYSPNKELADAARASFAKSRAAIKAETLNNAAQNGLTDSTYLKLKVQENDDEFFVEMADEISQLQGGLSMAQQFINENIGKVTTAAIDKAQKALEEDLLVDSIMNDPMGFIKDGKYDKQKAYDIAPNLNDRDRNRILMSNVGAAKKAMQEGTELSPTDYKMLNAVGEKIVEKTTEMFYNIGIVNDATLGLIKSPDKDLKNAHIENMKKNRKALTVADSFRLFYDNFENVATSTVVIDKRNGQEVPLPDNPTQAALQLAQLAKQPDVYIIQDQGELGGYNLAQMQREFDNFLSFEKGFSDEPSRGFVTRESYSTFDAITSASRDTYRLKAGDMPQVFRYMLTHLKDNGIRKDGTYGLLYEHLQNFDFFKKGTYDDLLKLYQEDQGNNPLSEINELYTNAVMGTLGKGNKAVGRASMPVDSIVVGNLADYIKGRKAGARDSYFIYATGLNKL